jgi:hypothetical protein
VSGVGDVGSLDHARLCGFAQKPLPERFVHLAGAHPLERIHSDQPLNYVLRSLRYILVDVIEISLANLLKKIVLVFCPERIVSLQDNEHEDPQTPQICVCRDMILFRYNLRRHVGGSPAESVNSVRRGRLKAKTKID